MSAVTRPHPTAGADNVPGGGSCPDWLLLLDEPAPARVLLVGPPARDTLEWFVDSGAIVTRAPALPFEPPRLPYDLVVVDAPDGPATPTPEDLARLARCCHPRGEMRLPWHPDHPLRGVLGRAGFPGVRAEVEVTGRRRPAPGHGLVAGRRPAGSAPAWLEDLGRAVSLPVDASRWSLQVPEDYPSRKAIARLPGSARDGGIVVKLTRHPRFNPRLENEASRLRAATTLGRPVTGAMPAVLASGPVAGLAMVVETAVEGRPFLEVSRLGPSCPLAAAAVEWSTRLAVASARPLPGPVLGDRLEDLLGRFEQRFAPPTATSRFLRDQVRQVAGAGTLPGVLFHGDLGAWNLLAARGEVRVLDWESAEWPGPPLWDLLYFLRSFAVRSGRRRGMRRDHAIRRHLVDGSRLTEVGAGWVRRYCEAVGLDRELVGPLFHTCWLHRAVKESSRLPAGAGGHYGPLCMRLVASRDAPGLGALVGTASSRG